MFSKGGDDWHTQRLKRSRQVDEPCRVQRALIANINFIVKKDDDDDENKKTLYFETKDINYYELLISYLTSPKITTSTESKPSPINII